MANLKMTLLENSISFFLESVTKAIQAEKNSVKWKFAILLLVQAIETCLKERLKRTHEKFVYTNIDKPKHTVDLGLAIDRLENISKVKFKKSDLKNIRVASELRNKIVHFEFDLSIDQIKFNFVALVGFYTSFCQNQLNTDIVSSLPGELHTELLSLDSYVKELELRAEERIKDENINSDDIWECPACKKGTFIIYDRKDICYLCSHQEHVAECESCNTLDFEENMQEFDFGNMKGLEDFKDICSECMYKYGEVDLFEHYN